ncbi:MAG: hypothetical protein HQL21_04445 [Candidatus Omnitrophica bacterium]|nr:hypothetical protein [Candidatus Omnitrophota bacterium]
MFFSSQRKYRANTLLEYAAVFCMVVGVFVVMSLYMKQGMQGQIRKAGEVFGYGRQ